MKLVLFDCDGTLVDSAATIHDCMEKAFIDFGFEPPSLAQTKSIIGLSLGIAIRQLLGEGVKADIDAIVERYKDHFIVIRDGGNYFETLYPPIRPMLEHLSQQDEIILGIVTGKSQRGVRAILDSHGFLDMFYTIHTADECQSKPSPDMVEQCCKDAGIEPKDTYVIGDSTFDMQMAKSAGAISIGVDWGYASVDDLTASGADYIVSNGDEIIKIIG